MKQNILLATLALLLLYTNVIYSQEQLSFLQEEKQWVMQYQLVLGPEYEEISFLETTKLKEDTIIDGILFKREYVYSSSPHTTHTNEWVKSDLFIGQEEQKIYEYSSKSESKRLLFDFSLKKGEKVTLTDFSPDKENYIIYEVTEITDTLLPGSSDKLLRKCLHLKELDSQVFEDDIWVEGIGSLKYGILGNIYSSNTGAILSFLECSNGSDIYYKNSSEISSINTPQPKGSSFHFLTTYPENYYFDLQGRRLTSKPAKGVYIRDGRKYVNQ